MFQKLKNNFEYFVLAAFLLSTVFIWLGVFGREQSDMAEIDFFDVGQGNAVLAQFGGNQMLVDGGPSAAILEKLANEMPLFDRKIELLVLTHPDADHLNGLIEILKKFEVERILETGISDDSAGYRVWNSSVVEKKIPVVFAQAGQMVKIADNFSFKILYPIDKIAGEDFSGKANASSIVGKLVFGKNSFLLTGDAEKNTEAFLEVSGADLKADVLQVGHHGSKNSTGEDFLVAVLPRIAVIQVGAKNSYGHPHQETLDKLKNVEVFRTDKNGDIKFLCDLESCAISTRKAREVGL